MLRDVSILNTEEQTYVRYHSVIPYGTSEKMSTESFRFPSLKADDYPLTTAGSALI